MKESEGSEGEMKEGLPFFAPTERWWVLRESFRGGAFVIAEDTPALGARCCKVLRGDASTRM